jgi:hypothetical protein
MRTREPGTLVAAGLMLCSMAVGMVTTGFVSLFWVLGCSSTDNAAGPAPGTTQRAFCDTLTSPGGALICVLAYVAGGIALAILAGRWRNGGRVWWLVAALAAPMLAPIATFAVLISPWIADNAGS